MKAPPSGTGNVYVIYRGQAEPTTRLEAPDLSITTAKLADEAVTLAKLEHGTSSNDGKFLRANNRQTLRLRQLVQPRQTEV